MKAEVKNVTLNKDTRQIIVTINAKNSIYIDEPKGFGFPLLLNSAPLVEGFNHVLEFGFEGVATMKECDRLRSRITYLENLIKEYTGKMLSNISEHEQRLD